MKRSRYNTSEHVDNARDRINEPGGSCDNKSLSHSDFVQVTKLGSMPHERLSKVFTGKAKLPTSPVKMLLGREFNYSGRGRFSLSDSCHVSSQYLPVYGPSVIDEVRSRASISQFSADGSLFVAAETRGHIRIYDVDLGWKIHKDIWAIGFGRSITDTCLSPDCRALVYSSLSSVATFVNTTSVANDSKANETEIHEGLELNTSNGTNDRDYNFHIHCIKFSTDGRKIVAGSNRCSLSFYDLEARKLSLKIHQAHRSNVSAVCYADESGNIVYSGSDDYTCKVWDTRCLENGQAVGGLIGHMKGITFIDTRGDGNYLISNGKDQAIKLWDIRKMSSNHADYPQMITLGRRKHWKVYPNSRIPFNSEFNKDLSLATYSGHAVLRSLVRCYFSPAYSTGQKYIYSGSDDASVYIYDAVSGNVIARLDYHEDPVTDCNWHPFYPMLVSSSWDGQIARWEFPGNDEKQNIRRGMSRHVAAMQ